MEIAGIASSANGLWMAQIARNLTDVINGFFTGKRYLIHDRDPLYTKEFLSVIASSGIEAIKLHRDRRYGLRNCCVTEPTASRQRSGKHTIKLFSPALHGLVFSMNAIES